MHVRMHSFSSNGFTHCLLDGGHDPHALTVLKLATISWNNLNKMSICLCRITSQMLPREMSKDLNSTFGRMQIVSNGRDLKIKSFCNFPNLIWNWMRETHFIIKCGMLLTSFCFNGGSPMKRTKDF